jgi:Transmembrane secretion effector
VFFGGQSLGALVWGIVAEHAGTRVALECVAGGLALSVLVGRRWPLRLRHMLDLSPAEASPEPVLAVDPDPRHGPVLVEIEYRVPVEHADEFREAMQPVGRARRRSGGTRWGLFQDAEDPERFVEAYIVPTWEEHLRQHGERRTQLDHELQQRARALLVEGTEPHVEHLLFAYDQ